METLIAALLTAALTMGVPGSAISSDTEAIRETTMPATTRAAWITETMVPVAVAPIDQFADAGKMDEPEMVYAGTYRVTGYDACVKCCGKADGITASGVKAEVGRTIATGREFAFGTVLYIEGIGYRTVEDRGVGNGCIDVFCADHPECYAITGYYDVYLLKEG